MSNGKGIWFVYRSHYDGPLSKRVCRIDAPSILAWFQEKLADARSSATPRDVADADLGGSVYGFGSLLAAAKEHKLAAPKSTAALRAMLRKHLYVEGGPESIRVDDHTVRVVTDDDEVMLAYYFFDDEAVREHQESVAWLLEEDPALVDGDEDGPFAPKMPLPSIEPGGGGAGATYACLLTFADGESIPGKAAVIPGVRLPDLAAHLRRIVPASKPQAWSPEWLDTWPLELRLLRAMIDAKDTTIAAALERCARYPIVAVAGRTNHSRVGIGPHAAARGELVQAAEGHEHGGDPDQSIVHEGEHVAVLCAHTSAHFGHQQWIFFDDRWAAAYPDLAHSLLRYATDWDPFPWEEEELPMSAAPMSAATLAARTHEAAWEAALEGRGPESARRYVPKDRFAAGEIIDHAKFGLGIVRRTEPSKIEVLFKDATRTLAHGAG
jgi:hypothetical protein